MTDYERKYMELNTGFNIEHEKCAVHKTQNNLIC